MRKYWIVNDFNALWAFPGNCWEDGAISLDDEGDPKADCMGNSVKEFGVDCITGEDYELLIDWYGSSIKSDGVVNEYEKFLDSMLFDINLDVDVVSDMYVKAIKFSERVNQSGSGLDGESPKSEWVSLGEKREFKYDLNQIAKYDIITDVYEVCYEGADVDEAITMHSQSIGEEWTTLADMIKEYCQFPGRTLKIDRVGGADRKNAWDGTIFKMEVPA